MTNVAFGSVNVLSATSADTSGTWTLNCTSLPSGRYLCLSIDAGSGGSSGAARLIVSGANPLSYRLYQDSGRSVSWGSKTSTAFGSPGSVYTSSSVVNTSVPIYARLTLSSTAPPGSYVANFSGTQAYVYMLSSGFSDCATGTVDPALGSTSTPFNVSANVAAGCELAANPLPFGTQSSLAANIDASTTISPRCTNTTPYSVTLDNGQNGASPAARKMASNSNFISYGLYADSARTTAWGTTNPVSATGSGVSQSIPVYGRVPAQSTPPSGTYSDVVVVTLSY